MLPAIESTVTFTITDFLTGLGLYGGSVVLEEKTFLPGVDIVAGKLVVDESRLLYPGDLLHEAGHLAVVPSEERSRLNGDVGSGPGDEMGAIAWSWAALRHLGLAPEVVFHPHGYRGASASIITAFSQDGGFGVPILEWKELTATGEHASQLGVPPFPHMLKWLVD